MSPRRTLICTFTALTSGVVGAYLGGQLSVSAQNRDCEARFWGPKPVCKVVAAPGAMWQGSLTGLGAGAVLGAFLAGLATRKATPTPTFTIHSEALQHPESQVAPTTPTADPSEPDLSGPPATLTSLQTEVL